MLNIEKNRIDSDTQIFHLISKDKQVVREGSQNLKIAKVGL